MKAVKAIGIVALFAAFFSPIAYLVDLLSLETCKTALLLATIVWFAVAGYSLWRDQRKVST